MSTKNNSLLLVEIFNKKSIVNMLFYFELNHFNRQGDTSVAEIYDIDLTIKCLFFFLNDLIWNSHNLLL